jgi:hypothetical protein
MPPKATEAIRDRGRGLSLHALSVRRSFSTIDALTEIVTEFGTELADDRCVLSVFRYARERNAGWGRTNHPTASVESTMSLPPNHLPDRSLTPQFVPWTRLNDMRE